MEYRILYETPEQELKFVGYLFQTKEIAYAYAKNWKLSVYQVFSKEASDKLLEAISTQHFARYEPNNEPRSMINTMLFEPEEATEPWHPNSLKDVNWFPRDKHGITKIPIAKPKTIGGKKK